MDANERLILAVRLAARKLAGSGPFDPMLKEVLSICVEAVGATGGTIYVHSPEEKTLTFQHVLPEDVAGKLPFRVLPDTFGVVGRVFHSRQAEVTQEHDDESHRRIAHSTGIHVRNMATMPLMLPEEEPIGVVQLINKSNGGFTEMDLAVLETVSSVSTMAFLNRGLLDQSARAMQLLGMGRVAHDIKNMAAAQISMVEYTELPLAFLSGELGGLDLDEESRKYAAEAVSMLRQIRKSLQLTMDYTKLLSDLSAGGDLRPNFQLEPLADTISTAASYYAPECRKHGIALQFEIETDAPPVCHDKLYLFRIVQNLVSNAIKAVRDKHSPVSDSGKIGTVTVRYRHFTEYHVLEVEDTGPGLSDDRIQRILAGQARSMWEKASGSGWGTKIVLNLVDALQGTLQIDSEVGVGSTFRVVLPDRSPAECPKALTPEVS